MGKNASNLALFSGIIVLGDFIVYSINNHSVFGSAFVVFDEIERVIA